MLRLSSVAAGVSLIAFSTLAFAGADNATNEGSAFSPTASEGGLKSEPSVSTAPSTGVATSSANEPLALAAPTDVDAVPVLKHIASTGAQLLELGSAHGLRSCREPFWRENSV
jgi:thiol:disulfide interchange protein DsbG